jgi:hypothetical protein
MAITIDYRFDENNNVVQGGAFRKHVISVRLDDSGAKRRCAMQIHFAAPRSTTHPDTIITPPGVPRLELWRGPVVLRSLFTTKTAKPEESASDSCRSHWYDDPAASRGL